MSRSAKLHWLISCCSVLLAGFLFSATLAPDAISSPAFNIVNQALFISLACYLLLPDAGNLKAIFINSASAVVLFIMLSRMPLTAGIPVTILLQLCTVVFCLGTLLWSLTQLLRHFFPGSDSIRINVILLTALITSAPVWLGPVAEIYQADDVIVNSVVSLTPLTHFSVAAEYDYLRSEWMYQNSAFGSLPFAYPGFAGITACYFLFLFIVQLILWGVTRHPRILKSLHWPRKNYVP
jgi:hypothetical protein